MEGIKIEVTGNIARVIEKPAKITAGTVGMPVEFTFDSHWAGLNKTAVFLAGNRQMIFYGLENIATVPWEILQKPGVRLNIGAYGENADGSVAIPTVWAAVGAIFPGADPDGAPSTDHPISVWEQLREEIKHIPQVIEAELTEAKDSGEFDGPRGDTGPRGLKGEKGDPGSGVKILGSYDTEAELIAAHPSGSYGDGYMVSGDLYVWTGRAWENVGHIQGPTGKTAYEYAQEGGYTGTEDEFIDKLAETAVPKTNESECHIIAGAKNATLYRLAVTTGGNLRVDTSTDKGATWTTVYYVPKTKNAGSAASPVLTSSGRAGSLSLYNGNDAKFGSGLWLYGNDHATGNGKFRLQVYDEANNVWRRLDGSPDGKLTWDGKKIITEAELTPVETDLAATKKKPYGMLSTENVYFYVDGINGSDANDGSTSAKAFKTLDRFLEELNRRAECRCKFVGNCAEYDMTSVETFNNVGIHLINESNVSNITIHFKGVATPAFYNSHVNIGGTADKHFTLDVPNNLYFDGGYGILCKYTKIADGGMAVNGCFGNFENCEFSGASLKGSGATIYLRNCTMVNDGNALVSANEGSTVYIRTKFTGGGNIVDAAGTGWYGAICGIGSRIILDCALTNEGLTGPGMRLQTCEVLCTDARFATWNIGGSVFKTSVRLGESYNYLNG